MNEAKLSPKRPYEDRIGEIAQYIGSLLPDTSDASAGPTSITAQEVRPETAQPDEPHLAA